MEYQHTDCNIFICVLLLVNNQIAAIDLFILNCLLQKVSTVI